MGILSSAYSQCADDVAVQGGNLVLNWTNPQNAQDPASIIYDGTSYTGSQSGGAKKWITDAGGFNNNDINGCHVLEIMGATCYYYDGDRYSAMTVSVCDQVNVSCNGGNDGYATLCVSGSIGPYSFSWDNGDTDSLATGLSAGTDTVTVTDANGCQATTLLVNITEPAPLSASYTDTTMASCKDVCDGSLTIAATGGTTPYSYAWSDGQNTSTATALCKGDYDVTITDAKGCQVVLNQVKIEEPKELKIKKIKNIDVTCNGYCDGQAWIDSLTEKDGGTPPYTYEWVNSSGTVISTSDTATTLCAGGYSIKITDSNGCYDITNTTIQEPDTISATIEIKGESCPGCCDGEVKVKDEKGGNGGYTYVWLDENGDTVSTSDKVTNSCDSIKYTVIVTDNLSCTNTFESSLIANIDIQYKCDGSCPDIQSTVSGGLSPFAYEWVYASDTATVLETNKDYNCVADSSYILTVTDAVGDVFVLDFTVANPYPMTATITDSAMVSCKGLCDGSATVLTTGGILPYSYKWDKKISQVTAVATGLCKDKHKVDVTDANGCKVSAEVDITEPTELMIDAISSSNAACYNSCDGQASVDAESGGTPGYNYTWITNEGDTVASGDDTVSLCAGDYTVILNDTNGCTKTASYNIGRPDSIKIIPSSNSTSCIGEQDGSASATVTGGTGAYSYSWIYDVTGTEESTSNPADSLYDGDYTLTVTDVNGCANDVAVNVPSPEDAYCPDTVYVFSGRLYMEWTNSIQPGCISSIWVDMNSSGSYINYTGSFTGTTIWRTDNSSFGGMTDTTKIFIANSRCIFDGGGAIVLPLNLFSFTAEQRQENVELQWSINPQNDSYDYVVEKSPSGFAFEDAGKITEPTDMGIVNAYMALDEQPFSGLNYYRLKQINPNGSIERSPTIVIRYRGNNSFEAYPNPVRRNNSINISWEKSPAEEMLLVLIDVFGNQLYSKVIIRENTRIPLVIDLQEQLPAGVYFVIGSSNGRVLEKTKIVVQ